MNVPDSVIIIETLLTTSSRSLSSTVFSKQTRMNNMLWGQWLQFQFVENFAGKVVFIIAFCLEIKFCNGSFRNSCPPGNEEGMGGENALETHTYTHTHTHTHTN